MSDGPLDDLIPGLFRSQPPRQAGAVHPRVLEVQLGPPAKSPAGPGGVKADVAEWLLIVWRDPGGAPALHQELRKLVEATLLAELSRPARSAAAYRRRQVRALRLLLFEAPPGDIAPALAAFGFAPQPSRDPLPGAALHMVAQEAVACDLPAPGAPAAVWLAHLELPDAAAAPDLWSLDAQMAKELGDEVWGEQPGRLASLLADRIAETGQPRPTLDLPGLDQVEALLARDHRAAPAADGSAPIRWIPPLLFQALCDLCGVAATHDLGASLQWAMCAPDQAGLCDPPIFRREVPGGHTHLPIALHVLRWCIMPLRPGEEIPPLSAWLRDQLG